VKSSRRDAFSLDNLRPSVVYEGARAGDRLDFPPARAAAMDTLLNVRGLIKRYDGVQALAGVDLDVLPGEVHAVVGENGAGKSTLLKTLSGAVRPDAGDVRFGGAPLPVGSPRACEACGIVTIYQEFTLIPALTAAQNIFLGHEAAIPGRGAARRTAMRVRAAGLLADLLAGVDPDRPVRELSVPERQMVEIARALSRESRLILMDEPTATLTAQETARLHETVRRLRARGVSVLYISHRLEEVLELADRVTILRDGRRVETLAAAEATLDRLIRGMVGRSITEHYPKETGRVGDPLLEIRSPGGPTVRVRGGEVVGLAGLVGSGRTELVRAAFGAERRPGLSFEWRGRPLRPTAPRQAIRLGIGMVPEDRQGQGLVLGLGVDINIALPNLDQLSAGWLPARGGPRRLAEPLIRDLRIRLADPSQPVRSLSGGNQQKVVLAKWLARRSQLLILDEPTRGIDVGAKQEMYRLMNRLVRDGKGVLLISSDLPEVIAMSDRLYVMRCHRVVAELDARAASPEAVMAHATGLGG
jgi:ribose transport system ATP-binding protein